MARGESLRSDVRCRDKPFPPKGAAAVGHHGEVRQCSAQWHQHSRCVPVGESPMGKLCLRGDPRVCGQCVFQARGLIAVGQRLAPTSNARTNYVMEETLLKFFPRWRRFRAPHVVRSLGRPH